MESPIWHLCRSGQTYGPYTSSQLREWVAQRRVTNGDLIWRDGLDGWQQITRLEYILPEEELEDTPSGEPDTKPDEPEIEPFTPPQHKPKEPEPWPFDHMAEGDDEAEDDDEEGGSDELREA